MLDDWRQISQALEAPEVIGIGGTIQLRLQVPKVPLFAQPVDSANDVGQEMTDFDKAKNG